MVEHLIGRFISQDLWASKLTLSKFHKIHFLPRNFQALESKTLFWCIFKYFETFNSLRKYFDEKKLSKFQIIFFGTIIFSSIFIKFVENYKKSKITTFTK